ncbi:MAG: RecX family transcriptional regulator, partial [Proteiniphilum sp.]
MDGPKKMITPEQAYARMSRICAQKEYAPYDIRQKLLRMELPADAVETLLSRLKKEKYLDEKRYAESYIHDKLH